MTDILSRISELERVFWSKVDKRGPNGCWMWTGGTGGSGYGRIYVGRREVAWAHRLSHELHKGAVPEGLQVDHLCRNKVCVNPDHLEAVTSRENTLRGVGPSAQNARKTHCRRGHPLAGDNLALLHKRSASGETRAVRKCRACHRQYQRMVQCGHRGPGHKIDGFRKPPVFLTDDQVRSAYLRIHGGETAASVARDLGIDKSTAKRIARRETRRAALSALVEEDEDA